MLKKYYQNDRVTCAACAYGSCLSGVGVYLTEAQCCDEVKTDRQGTSNHSVLAALHKRKIEVINRHRRQGIIKNIISYRKVNVFGEVEN